MSRTNDLPFERGSTYYEGDTALIAAADGINLEGTKYIVQDSASGQELTLMIVKNATGSTLTAPGGKGLAPKAAYIGRRVNSTVGSAGGYGHICDPLQVNNVVDGDLFYVVDSGYVTGAKLGASNAVDFGVCCFNSTGNLIPIGTQDGYVVGRFAAAVTSTGDGNETVDVVVGGSAADYDNAP